jgi:hypothetical protein
MPKLTLTESQALLWLRVCSDQWRAIGGFGGTAKTGIPHADAEAGARLLHLETTEEMFLLFKSGVNLLREQESKRLQDAADQR